MEMASSPPCFRLHFDSVNSNKASTGAAPPGNNIAQWYSTPWSHGVMRVIEIINNTREHRDYKRIGAASGDEPRNKLNKSNVRQ